MAERTHLRSRESSSANKQFGEDIRMSPRELRKIILSSRRLVSSDITGAFRSIFRGTGLTFRDLTEYRPGDDPRSIDWRATARTGRVFIKTYEEERSLRIHGIFDRSASVGDDRRVYEFAAALALLAERDRDVFSLSCFGTGPISFERIPPRGHFLPAALGFLKSSPPTADRSNLSGALEELFRGLAKRHIVFIVSDFHVPPAERELKRLASRHDLIFVYIEPTQFFLPQAIVVLRDAESGAPVEIDGRDPVVRQKFEERRRLHLTTLKLLAKSCGATVGVLRDSSIRCLSEICARRSSRR